MPAGTPVLDLAAGGGRHTRLFLARGHPVSALDRDVGGLEDLRGVPNIEVIEADLEDGSPWPLAGRCFGAVVVANYLWRPLFPSIIAAVGAGGVLLYETFARGNETYGPPRNPDFLLRPGELIGAVQSKLQIVAYEHGFFEHLRPAIRQRICALRSDQPAALDSGMSRMLGQNGYSKK